MRRSLFFAALLAATSGIAHANGAFPDAQQVVLPSDRPHQILVGTNFGILISNDDGATWQWVCENVIGAFAGLYQMGAAPADRLVAKTMNGAVSSGDTACTWTTAVTPFPPENLTDLFPDPNDANKVYGIGIVPLDGGTAQYGIYVSSDGARTFPTSPLYAVPTNAVLSSIESSRSAPGTIYAAMFATGPSMLRSVDGGTTFQTFDLSATTTAPLYIAAVDPVNASLLYLLAKTSPPGDSLAISSDGGMTIRLAVELSAAMTCFLKRADGTLLMGAVDGTGYRSKDEGQTFSPWKTPHLRGLAERNGIVYAATSNVVDGYAVAMTTDEGTTWTPLLRLQDIQGPADCAKDACAGPFATLIATLTANSDMGVPSDMTTAPPPKKSGCHCSIGAAGPSEWLPALFLSLLILGLLVYRSTRRSNDGRN
jgi:hypothetical protein